jgi:hypothetical protein
MRVGSTLSAKGKYVGDCVKTQAGNQFTELLEDLTITALWPGALCSLISVATMSVVCCAAHVY